MADRLQRRRRRRRTEYFRGIAARMSAFNQALARCEGNTLDEFLLNLSLANQLTPREYRSGPWMTRGGKPQRRVKHGPF